MDTNSDKIDMFGPNLIFLFSILWSSSVNCDESAKSNDLDGNGKVDRWIKYNSGKLRAQSFDTNNDGRADVFLSYYPQAHISRIRMDKNFDGKIDFLKVFFPQNLLSAIEISDNNYDRRIDSVRETIIDKKNFFLKTSTISAGKLNLVSFSSSTVEQEKLTCCSLAPGPSYSQLKSFVRSLVSREDEYISIKNGFRIQNECVVKFGRERIENIVTKAIEKGQSCLLQLGSPASIRNAHLMESLLKNQENPPKLICDEIDYDGWSRAAAHGSRSSSQFNHPYISLNPNSAEQSDEVLEETIFHEFFHNCGYSHGSDIEFAYACEECCFKVKLSEMACKVCRGKYTSSTDTIYLRDLSLWASQAVNSRALEKRFVSIASEGSQKNPKAVYLAARATMGRPLGVALANELVANGNRLTKNKIRFLEGFDFKGYEAFETSAAQLAKAIWSANQGKLLDAERLLMNLEIPKIGDDRQWYGDFLEDMRLEAALSVLRTHSESSTAAKNIDIWEKFINGRLN